MNRKKPCELIAGPIREFQTNRGSLTEVYPTTTRYAAALSRIKIYVIRRRVLFDGTSHPQFGDLDGVKRLLEIGD
jgi:hypothetical protein